MARNRSLRQQSADLERRLNAIPQEILDALRPALVKSAEQVAANMRSFAEASRDTGALIDSITVTPPGGTTPPYAEGGGTRTAGPNQALVTVGNDAVRYAHILEFGSVKMEPEPFFLPGFRTAKPIIQPRINRAIGAIIKKYLPR